MGGMRFKSHATHHDVLVMCRRMAERLPRLLHVTVQWPVHLGQHGPTGLQIQQHDLQREQHDGDNTADRYGDAVEIMHPRVIQIDAI